MRAAPKFPRYTRASRTGNKGVRIVENIIHDHFGWILREQEGQKDFGIDAHIELMDGDKVLGRIFAVQIKCGGSYFKKKNEDGYVYYGQQKHLNYFLNYSIPVILVLCDPKKQKCWWCEINPSEMEETRNGWQITVPFDQLLDLDAKDKLATLAGPAKDYIPGIQEYWFVNNLLQKYANMLLLLVDRREHIEAGDITDVLRALNRLRVTKKLTRKYEERVEIGVSGYDDDPRALYDIPEVREWFIKLDKEFPFWFYFLSKTGGTLKLITLIVCGYSRSAEALLELDKPAFGRFLEHHFVAMNTICESVGLGEDQIFRLSKSVFSYYDEEKETNWDEIMLPMK